MCNQLTPTVPLSITSDFIATILVRSLTTHALNTSLKHNIENILLYTRFII